MIPGTFLNGWEPPPLRSEPIEPRSVPAGVEYPSLWRLGECRVIRFRDASGVQLTVSHPERYPTWDEIKTARYRLLPTSRTFALLLPPPDEYQDTPAGSHVFQLVEVPR